jgi:hypothetical protein
MVGSGMKGPKSELGGLKGIIFFEWQIRKQLLVSFKKCAHNFFDYF